MDLMAILATGRVVILVTVTEDIPVMAMEVILVILTMDTLAMVVMVIPADGVAPAGVGSFASYRALF